MTLDCHGSDMTRFLDQISSHLGGQGQLMEEACVVARAAESGDLALDLGPFLQRDYPKAGRKEAGRGRGWEQVLPGATEEGDHLARLRPHCAWAPYRCLDTCCGVAGVSEGARDHSCMWNKNPTFQG